MDRSNVALASDTLRASPLMWVLFGVPGPTIAFISAISSVHGGYDLWYLTIIMAQCSALIFAWLKTAALTRTNDAVCYRALLIRESIPLSDVLWAKIEPTTSAIWPTQQIVIERHDKQERYMRTIKLFLFSNTRAMQWVDALNMALLARNGPVPTVQRDLFEEVPTSRAARERGNI